MVDDSVEFSRIVRNCYRNSKDMEEDVKKFQLATATSFFKSSVVTRQQYERRSGKALPEGYAYQYVQFRCVHSKRKSVRGKRYRDYDCKARFSFTLKGLWYQRGEFSLLHSHEFDRSNRWLYASNRRLSEAEELQVCDLMSTFKSSQMVCQYVASQYGRHLNRGDLWSIKRRHGKLKSSKVSGVIDFPEQHSTYRRRVPEPVGADTPTIVPHVEDAKVKGMEEVHHASVTNQTTKLPTVEQVMANLTVHLHRLGTTRCQQLIQSLGLLGELMSTEAEISLYCKTRHCTEPLPLSDTDDLLRLQGKSPTRLAERGHMQDGALPCICTDGAVENGDGGALFRCLRYPKEMRSNNWNAVNKRKVLVQRATNIPIGTAVRRGIKSRRPVAASSVNFQDGAFCQQMAATSSLPLNSDVCGVCSQVDDPRKRCSAVDWVLCDVCGSWFHQACTDFRGKESFTCVFCAS